jgi:cell division protein FtsI (penicillin-binding protein 3)
MSRFLDSIRSPQGSRRHGETLHIDGERNRALETGRNRLLVTGAMFVLAFAVISGRLVEVSLFKGSANAMPHVAKSDADIGVERADVVDRNGVLLATSLPTVSLYARPKEIGDKPDAARKVASILTDMSASDIQGKLRENRAFIYLRRNLTPRQEYDINALGIPGLYFEKGEKRIYPQGELTAHVVGLTDLDNKGIAGIEKSEERELKGRHDPLRLSIDVRVQTILRNELVKAVQDFTAVGATGMVMDVRTGEVVAMASLPDFNPNYLSSATPEAMFNRATLGVYEMGSTFKLFNTAAMLDDGVATMASTFDATHPLEFAGFTIHDDHPLNRWANMTDILIDSSNIGSARMAMELGIDRQREFLGRMGLLHPASLELPEIGAPLVPNPWREINSLTIAFGHGMAVSPLQLVTGVSALVNGGEMHPPTLLARADGEAVPSTRVVKRQTSDQLRQMMRMVVSDGTGNTADVPGYEVAGKTGTAEKSGAHGYRKKANLASFIATFPGNDPRYVVLVMIDEPHGNKETFGLAQAHWNAAPAVGHVIAQIGPLLGLTPSPVNYDEAKKPSMAVNAVATKGANLAEVE